jgi:hypothetical protein
MPAAAFGGNGLEFHLHHQQDAFFFCLSVIRAAHQCLASMAHPLIHDELRNTGIYAHGLEKMAKAVNDQAVGFSASRSRGNLGLRPGRGLG